MKKIIFVLLALFSFSSFAEPVDPLEAVGDRCAPGDIVFYGQTEKGHKEVLVCRWGDTIFYRFGKIGQKPDLDIKMKDSKVTAQIENTSDTSGEQVVIPYGEVRYLVGAKSVFSQKKDYGWVKVVKADGSPVTTIPLIGSGTISDIRNQITNLQSVDVGRKPAEKPIKPIADQMRDSISSAISEEIFRSLSKPQ